MDYEKKYKEALSRAKSFELPEYKNIAESIFPELKNEDEKIRKALVDALNKNLGNGIEKYGTTLNAALTWLEKQDKSSDQIHYWTEEEIEPIINDYLRGAEHYGGMIGRLRCLKPKSLEKQGKVPVTINVDKMVKNYANNKECGNEGFGKPINCMIRAYRQGIMDTLEKQVNCSAKWQKNTPDNKPTIRHSVLMKTTQGIAEGEWQGEDWFQYRWSWTLKDSYVLAWMELSDLDEQGEQKPSNVDYYQVDDEVGNLNDWVITTSHDKVEPKFKTGNWYQCIKDFYGKGVRFDAGKAYYCSADGCLQESDESAHIVIDYNLYDRFKPWTIADAKSGDVLCWDDSKCIALFKNIDDKDSFNSYGFVGHCTGTFETRLSYHDIEGAHPATKEQRDLLFSKMKEAEYEFDFDNKELKKIEDEEYNGEDYGIDGLWHAQRILEKTLGDVDGYQSDDGILEHKAAITAVKKLCEQKPDWSEDDEEMIDNIIDYMKPMPIFFESTNGKSGKEYTREFVKNAIKWLKFLKDRIAWNPSEEQIHAFEQVYEWYNNNFAPSETLTSLYNDLKKL